MVSFVFPVNDVSTGLLLCSDLNRCLRPGRYKTNPYNLYSIILQQNGTPENKATIIHHLICSDAVYVLKQDYW